MKKHLIDRSLFSAPLILASMSPRRAQLLSEYHISFIVACPAIEELSGDVLPPRELALANARAKAQDVSKQYSDDLILAADTIVVFQNKVFGKPKDYREAFGMLSQLAGNIHEVVTGVCLLHLTSSRRCEFIEVTRVKFRELKPAAIEAYLSDIDPLDKAGAYAAQEDKGRLIESIEGSLSNVVGLPMERVVEAIHKFVSNE